MKRRSFLRTAGTASAAAAAGVFSILKYPRGARAAGWGAWPSDRLDLRLPDELIAQNVLEIQLNGGMSPWDTFYTVPDWGLDDFRYVHQFHPDAGNFGEPPQPNRDERFETCMYGNEPMWVESGISDGDGVGLFLGPWTVPLRGRQDILSRMRIVVQRHDNVAHEGANPLCLTGDRLGQPRLAALGTAVQRYFTENPEAGGGSRTTPYSYVLFPGTGYSQGNTSSAAAVGFHPGSARPLGVPVAADSPLSNLLARNGPSDPASFDAAISYYRQQYEARFRTATIGSPTRSTERANYEFADFARRHAPDLQAILTPDQFMPIAAPPGECGGGGPGTDMPRMQARLAANLLTRDDGQARFVLWVDTGINPHPTGGHDNHTFHTAYAAQNVPHTLAAIAEIIGDGPGQLNLDTTMVIINTEFGRTPYRQLQAGQTGTNHWPWGYVTIFIGGPIRNPGCYGRVGYMPGAPIEGGEDGYAIDYVTPAENRMMVMQAMGIYPFSSQSFAVGDVRGGVTTEEEAAARIRETYLGVS